MAVLSRRAVWSPFFQACRCRSRAVLAWCFLLFGPTISSAELQSSSSRAAAVASARGTSAALRSRRSKTGWWPFDDDIAHSGDDVTPVSTWLGTASYAVIEAPDDLKERDEMAPEPAAPPRSANRRPRASLTSLAKKAKSKFTAPTNFVSMRSGVTNPDMVWNLRPPSVDEMAAGRPPEKVVDEYDEDLHPELEERQRRRGDAPVVQAAELPTREEKERLRFGDIEHVQAPVKPHPHHYHLHPHHGRHMMATQRRASVVAAVAKELPPAHAQMMTQCMGYASWLKQQNASGDELIGLWKNTCNQGGGAGATDQYRMMCDSLVGAVSEFADDPNWTPHVACEDVLRVFRESGVGGSPLKGF